MSARPRRAAFEHFSWLPDALAFDSDAMFAARMRDLGCGLSTCLALLEANDLERDYCVDQDPPKDGGEPAVPFISYFDSGNLMRLSVAIAEIIGEKAEKQIQYGIEKHERETAGREGRLS